MVGVAQLVERRVVVADVAGSSPVVHPDCAGRLRSPGHCPHILRDRGQTRGFRAVGSAYGGRMLITLDSTRPITESAMSDWSAISALTRWVNGIVSVGLNARMFVNATYR